VQTLVGVSAPQIRVVSEKISHNLVSLVGVPFGALGRIHVGREDSLSLEGHLLELSLRECLSVEVVAGLQLVEQLLRWLLVVELFSFALREQPQLVAMVDGGCTHVRQFMPRRVLLDGDVLGSGDRLVHRLQVSSLGGIVSLHLTTLGLGCTSAEPVVSTCFIVALVIL